MRAKMSALEAGSLRLFIPKGVLFVMLSFLENRPGETLTFFDNILGEILTFLEKRLGETLTFFDNLLGMSAYSCFRFWVGLEESLRKSSWVDWKVSSG